MCLHIALLPYASFLHLNMHALFLHLNMRASMLCYCGCYLQTTSHYVMSLHTVSDKVSESPCTVVTGCCWLPCLVMLQLWLLQVDSLKHSRLSRHSMLSRGKVQVCLGSAPTAVLQTASNSNSNRSLLSRMRIVLGTGFLLLGDKVIPRPTQRHFLPLLHTRAGCTGQMQVPCPCLCNPIHSQSRG